MLHHSLHGVPRRVAARAGPLRTCTSQGSGLSPHIIKNVIYHGLDALYCFLQKLLNGAVQRYDRCSARYVRDNGYIRYTVTRPVHTPLPRETTKASTLGAKKTPSAQTGS